MLKRLLIWNTVYSEKYSSSYKKRAFKVKYPIKTKNILDWSEFICSHTITSQQSFIKKTSMANCYQKVLKSQGLSALFKHVIVSYYMK
jgi:hypothetical protein